MKLYLWSSVHSLRDYAPGMAFAIANTKIQAIDLIVANLCPPYEEDEEYIINLRRELETLNPKVIDEPFGYSKCGSA